MRECTYLWFINCEQIKHKIWNFTTFMFQKKFKNLKISLKKEFKRGLYFYDCGNNTSHISKILKYSSIN